MFKQKSGVEVSVPMMIVGIILAIPLLFLIFSHMNGILQSNAEASNSRNFDAFASFFKEAAKDEGRPYDVNINIRNDHRIMAFNHLQDKVDNIARPCTLSGSEAVCLCACKDKKCEQIIGNECLLVDGVGMVIANEDIANPKRQIAGAEYFDGSNAYHFIIDGSDEKLNLIIQRRDNIVYVGKHKD